MIAYADSSFVVSLYLTDAHSALARAHIRHLKTLCLTPLHRAEWAHAVARHVFYGKLSELDAQKLQLAFADDQKSGLWLETEIPESAFETCIVLARKHVAHLGGRTLDSLHVACALELGATSFWTFDKRQTALAKAAGLSVVETI